MVKVGHAVNSLDDTLKEVGRDVGREGNGCKFSKSNVEVREKEVKLSDDCGGMGGKEAGEHLEFGHLVQPVQNKEELDLGLQDGLLVGLVVRREDGV